MYNLLEENLSPWCPRHLDGRAALKFSCFVDQMPVPRELVMLKSL